MAYIDITGQTFGRYTAHWPIGRFSKDDCMSWLCSCSCGSIRKVRVSQLRNGNNRSCGCFRAEQLKKNKAAVIHGKSHTTQGYMFYAAKQRAKKKKIPFDLDMHDVVIPEKCPFLGTPLKAALGKLSANSPTLDRIIPELGYVKGNVLVISHRANSAKNDLSLAELQTLCRNLAKFTESPNVDV